MKALVRLAWFCCIGGATTLAYAALAWLLTVPASWPPAVASALAYAACSVGSFACHKLFTFKSKAPVRGELGRYAATTALGYGLAIALPLVLTQMLHLDPRIAIALVCILSSSLNFVLLNAFVFKPPAIAPALRRQCDS